jgi:hypothetical protein
VAPSPHPTSAPWPLPPLTHCHRFWYQYHNIFALLKDLGGPWPLTPWTTSGFWSPRGLTTEAPVFSSLPRLPTLLGQVRGRGRCVGGGRVLHPCCLQVTS